MILKVLVPPVLLGIKAVCIMGNLLINIASYVVGTLLLVVGSCAVYCITQALWTSLAILIGMGLAVVLVIFMLVWAVVKAETIGNFLGKFISF